MRLARIMFKEDRELVSALLRSRPPGKSLVRTAWQLRRLLRGNRRAGIKMEVSKYADDILISARIDNRVVQIRPWGDRLPPRGRRARLTRPPGGRLDAFARFWFSRQTYSLVLGPTLRDLTDEYVEALAEGQPIKARWVRWRGTFAFWSAVVNQMPVSFLRLLHRLWKAAGS